MNNNDFENENDYENDYELNHKIIDGFDYGRIEKSDKRELVEFWVNRITGIFINKRSERKLFNYAVKNNYEPKFDGLNEKERKNRIMFNLFWKSILPYLLMFFGVYLGQGIMFFGGIGLFLVISMFVRPTAFNHSAIMNTEEAYKRLNVSTSQITNMNIWLFEYLLDLQENHGIVITENSQIFKDREFGLILELELEDIKKVRKTGDLTDYELVNLFWLPRINPRKQDEARYISNGKLYVLIDLLFMSKQGHTVNMAEMFASKPEYAYVFSDLKHIAKAKEEEMARLLEKEQFEKEKAELNVIVEEKGLNQKTTMALLNIRRRIEKWGFNYNRQKNNSGITGNEFYTKIKCQYIDGANYKSIMSIKHKLPSVLKCEDVMIQKSSDPSGFELIMLFNGDIKPFNMSTEEIRSYTENNKFFFGDSLTGKLSAKFNNQANHFIFGAGSGSGKSVGVVNTLYMLATLKDFKHDEMYLTSSSKLGDFTPFEERGAVLASGLDEQIKVAKYLLNKLIEREDLFRQEKVKNIAEYNAKHKAKPMTRIVFLADEYENSIASGGKQSKEFESLVLSILNIARSSGCIVGLGAQSVLKSVIGQAKAKMFLEYIGFSERNILRQMGSDIENYFLTLRKKPQGVFMLNSTNLEIEQEHLLFGDTGYTLIQTPYVCSDLSQPSLGILAEDIPNLNGGFEQGQALTKQILSADTDSVDEELEDVEVFSLSELKEESENENDLAFAKEIEALSSNAEMPNKSRLAPFKEVEEIEEVEQIEEVKKINIFDEIEDDYSL